MIPWHVMSLSPTRHHMLMLVLSHLFRGAYNRTYSLALRQPEKDLPRRPSAPNIGPLDYMANVWTCRYNLKWQTHKHTHTHMLMFECSNIHHRRPNLGCRCFKHRHSNIGSWSLKGRCWQICTIIHSGQTCCFLLLFSFLLLWISLLFMVDWSNKK